MGVCRVQEGRDGGGLRAPAGEDGGLGAAGGVGVWGLQRGGWSGGVATASPLVCTQGDGHLARPAAAPTLGRTWPPRERSRSGWAPVQRALMCTDGLDTHPARLPLGSPCRRTGAPGLSGGPPPHPAAPALSEALRGSGGEPAAQLWMDIPAGWTARLGGQQSDLSESAGSPPGSTEGAGDGPRGALWVRETSGQAQRTLSGSFCKHHGRSAWLGVLPPEGGLLRGPSRFLLRREGGSAGLRGDPMGSGPMLPAAGTRPYACALGFFCVLGAQEPLHLQVGPGAERTSTPALSPGETAGDMWVQGLGTV